LDGFLILRKDLGKDRVTVLERVALNQCGEKRKQQDHRTHLLQLLILRSLRLST
jgi:hypothetical protein